MTSLFLVYTAGAVALAVISFPFILRLVPPNKTYGLRSPLTLSDPDLWYRANTTGGLRLLCFALIVLTAAVLFYLVPGLEELAYQLGMLLIVAAGLGNLHYQNFRYLRQLEG